MLKQQQPFKGLGFLLLLAIMLLFASRLPQKSGIITNQELMQAIDNGTITSATVRQNDPPPTGRIEMTMADGSSKQANVSNVIEIQDLLDRNGITYTVDAVQKENLFLVITLPIILTAVALVFLFMLMNARAGAGSANAKMMNFGRSRAHLAKDANKINFSKVAGLEEEKEELEEVVDFLKNPSKYTGVGARIPRVFFW